MRAAAWRRRHDARASTCARARCRGLDGAPRCVKSTVRARARVVRGGRQASKHRSQVHIDNVRPERAHIGRAHFLLVGLLLVAIAGGGVELVVVEVCIVRLRARQSVHVLLGPSWYFQQVLQRKSVFPPLAALDAETRKLETAVPIFSACVDICVGASMVRMCGGGGLSRQQRLRRQSASRRCPCPCSRGERHEEHRVCRSCLLS